MAQTRKRKGASNSIMLLGMLAGAAVGAAIGLVITPTDGEGNRRRLSSWTTNRAQDLQDKAQSTVKGE